MRDHVVAVDVGTASARAAVFGLDGQQLSRSATPISIRRSPPCHLEQNSGEIWAAVCHSVRDALENAGLLPDRIAAIGFDATCSLVLRDKEARPLPTSAPGDGGFDTMLWMDHRATGETDECNATGHAVLHRFGGRLSPEMQIPKLMWLKRNLPDTWKRAGLVFDLADFLTFKATGSLARSHSTLVSKWAYEPEFPGARPDDFYRLVGLEDLAERGALPPISTPLSTPIGPLSAEAAAALGLTTGCIVAPGLIDAYAGAISLCAAANRRDGQDPDRHAALIAGTSSCVIRLSRTPCHSAGYWGPFRDVAIPDHWLLEGGQSASGALLDHIVRMHVSGGEPTRAVHTRILARIAEGLNADGADYGLPIHVLPDVHGTRSPLSDPSLTGSIVGLSLDQSFDGLCKLYWRASVGLACSIRHIIEQFGGDLPPLQTLSLAGGHARSGLIPQLYADVTGYTVMSPNSSDAVLLGTAMHTSVAAGLHADIEAAAQAMPLTLVATTPDPARQRSFERDYRIFLAMIRQRSELHALTLS